MHEVIYKINEWLHAQYRYFINASTCTINSLICVLLFCFAFYSLIRLRSMTATSHAEFRRGTCACVPLNGTYKNCWLQGISSGTWLKGISSGTWVQGISSGTWLQGISSGTWLQSISSGTWLFLRHVITRHFLWHLHDSFVSLVYILIKRFRGFSHIVHDPLQIVLILNVTSEKGRWCVLRGQTALWI